MDHGSLSRRAGVVGRAPRLVGCALAALVAALVAGCTPSATLRPLVKIDEAGPPGVIVIRDCTVFPALERAHGDRLVDFDVVVRDGKVASVEPTGALLPKGAVVIDGRGKTLLPGLVDAHVHIESSGALPTRDVRVPPEHNLEAWLYAGVTTVYDLGGDGKKLDALRGAVVTGAVPGPRIFHTGYPITAVGGHPLPLIRAVAPWPASALAGFIVPQARGPGDAAGLVDAQLRHHGDYVKLMRDALPAGSPELDAATLAALVNAAHAHGKKVLVHIGSAADAIAAARAGADVLAHAVYRGRITPDQAAELARRKVKVIATLASFHHVADVAHARLKETRLDEESAPPEALAPFLGDAARDLPPALLKIAGEAARDEAAWGDNVRTLHDAGVEVVPGSDGVFLGVAAGGPLHEELAWLVRAGIPASEVLYEATAGAAHLFLDAPSFGSIAPGESADLVLVDGDPVADIDATTRIAAVIRAGRVVTRLTP